MGRKILAKGTGTDAKIVVSETEYDVRGAVKQSSLPYFEVGGSPLFTTVTYDAVGRVLEAVNPDGSRTLTCYDDWVQVSINANDQKKRVVQDAGGRAIEVQEYLGTFTTCDTAVGTPYSTTLYQYDVLGNLRFVTDAQSNQSEMRYDELSRKVFMTDPDMGDWTYAYDTVGNLVLQTDAKSQQTHFQYDVLNRQVQKDFGTQKTLGSGDVVYTFDGATSNGIGRLTHVADSSGTSTFFYDIAGRSNKTDKVIGGTTYTTESAYDGLGRLITLMYPDDSCIIHTYNGPQLQSVRQGVTSYVSYAGFNALGQPATVTSGNGVVTTYTYDAQNFRLKTLKTVNSSITLQDLGYTFDAGGNVTGITNAIHGNQTFTYDDLNRLTNASGMTPTPSTYSYDQLGNMLSNSRVGNYSYTGGGPHAVKTAGTNTYSYDANGNMTSGAGRAIAYDFENRPTSITKSGVTTTFVYDGDGGRVQKTDGTGTTVYIGNLYVCENGACTKMIFAGSNRVAQKEVTGGATSYYHPDHLGSTSVITNAAGNNEQDLAYYPYGDTFINTGTKDVKFKYTGKERDDSTGLYFYEARYYDPLLGRFISADTIVPDPLNPQALNRYSYVLNNPIIYTDPTGNFGFFAFVAISAAISATVTAVQGGSIGDIFLSAAIGGAAAGVGFGVYGPIASAANSAVIGGIAAGAAAGLTGSVLNRVAGNNTNIGIAVGLGALAGGLGGGIVELDLPWAAEIVASGLVGGGISELAGGNFAEGFGFAAVTSAVFHYEDIADFMGGEQSQKFSSPEEAAAALSKNEYIIGKRPLEGSGGFTFKSSILNALDVELVHEQVFFKNSSGKFFDIGFFPEGLGPIRGNISQFTFGPIHKSIVPLSYGYFQNIPGFTSGDFNLLTNNCQSYCTIVRQTLSGQ